MERYNINNMPVLPNFKKIMEGDLSYLYVKNRKPVKKDQYYFNDIYEAFLRQRKKGNYNLLKTLQFENALNVWKINQTISICATLAYYYERDKLVDGLVEEIKELETPNLNKILRRLIKVKKRGKSNLACNLVKEANSLTANRFRLNFEDKDFLQKLQRMVNSVTILKVKVKKNEEIIKSFQSGGGDIDWGVFFMQVSKWHGNVDLKNTTVSELADLLNLLELENKKEHGKKSN